MSDEEIRKLKNAIVGKRAQKARFVEEYIKSGNGAEAVILAGATENRASAATMASRWLREPEVLAYRDALMEAEAAAIGVSRDSLIYKSEEIYRRCMQHKPVMEKNADGEWVETGEYVFDSKGAGRAVELQAKLIGALSEKREIEGGKGFVVNVSTLGEGQDAKS